MYVSVREDLNLNEGQINNLREYVELGGLLWINPEGSGGSRTAQALCDSLFPDLDLERLPSGKFDTNDLVMAFGAFAYNMLRWMGLRALLGKHAPIRHRAKRRRLRTRGQEQQEQNRDQQARHTGSRHWPAEKIHKSAPG